MSELTAPGKSFAISEWEVWEAWERVKANKGAPGVDGCSVGDFEADLKDNRKHSPRALCVTASSVGGSRVSLLAVTKMAW